MKTKSIIFSGLLLAMVGATTTSCEDMFDIDDELHTTNLAPQDTIYQMMGIINRIQCLADRTVVLGELRADLVEVDPEVATAALQNVINNDIDTENEYNQVADYYSVINSCNIYLANVDSLQMSHNKRKYEREVQAVKTFRAWTYLELAKVYGKVPFVLEPVTAVGTADDIVADQSNRADMNQICSYFIEDLLPYASKTIDMPNYGTINGFPSTEFFISARLMLAELYLWRGSFTQNKADYVEACRYYHDFFCYPSHFVNTGLASVTWGSTNRTFDRTPSDNYSGQISTDVICYMPLDTCDYNGNWSNLYAIFNSQYVNNYYVPVYPSQRIREISRSQVYCLYSETAGRRDTTYSTVKEEWEDSIYKGDLRFSAIYRPSAVSDKYSKVYSKERQHIMKWATSEGNFGPDNKVKSIGYFRKNIVWLHFAEALNRAGFPETAFAILKYGISPTTISRQVSRFERDRLEQVATYFNGNLASWPQLYSGGTSSGFYALADVTTNSTQTMKGIHSRGCGDSEYNDLYALPRDSAIWAEYDQLSGVADSLADAYNALYSAKMLNKEYRPLSDEEFETVERERSYIFYDGGTMDRYIFTFAADSDSIAFFGLQDARLEAYLAATEAEEKAYEAQSPDYPAFVEQLVLNEEALEGMFEGLRFYDLMRHALWVGDKDYIANQVAKRKGSAEYDDRADKLRGGNWYLPLPTR